MDCGGGSKEAEEERKGGFEGCEVEEGQYR